MHGAHFFSSSEHRSPAGIGRAGAHAPHDGEAGPPRPGSQCPATAEQRCTTALRPRTHASRDPRELSAPVHRSRSSASRETRNCRRSSRVACSIRDVVFMTSPRYTIARRLPPTSPVMTSPACGAAWRRGCARNSARNPARPPRDPARSRTSRRAAEQGDARQHHPRDHHFVAIVLIDLAARVVDRTRGEPEHLAEETTDGGGADALCERGRPGDVDEQEDALFQA